jgi:hypothetical protein
MKKETLDTAIHLGQLIRLLAPLGQAHKDFNKRLSRLHAGVESQVALAVLAGKTAAGVRAQARIGEVRAALLGALKGHLDLPELVRRLSVDRAVYPGHVITGASRRGCGDVLLDDAEAVKLEPNPGKGSDQAARAAVVHAYSSAVRNSNWLPTLLSLELSLHAATKESARLMRQHSTHEGREALNDSLRKLCSTYVPQEGLGNALTKPAQDGSKPAPKRSRAKKIAVKADGMFAVQVACRAENLLAHADIAALASVTFKGAEPEPKLADLLEKATRPVAVEPGEAPGAVAQRIVDELVAALVARKKLADDERAALRAKADAAAADSAVAALQQLNPTLLAALKKNPALLERA